MNSALSLRDDGIRSMNTTDGSEKRTRAGLQKKKKRNQKSYLEIHYQTVIILLRLKTNSYEKALFLFIILTFLISVTNMNNFLLIIQDLYPDLKTNSSAFSLMNSLKYLDVAQLLSFAGSSSLLITVSLSVYMISMTLFYCACYIYKVQYPKSKPRKYFYGRWFVNMSSYFIQILSFPFNVIFLSFVLCTDDNLAGEAEKCSFSGEQNTFYSIIFGFSLIGLILSVTNEWWLQLFFYNTKLYKKDATGVEKEPQFLLELSIFRLIVALFTTLKFTNSYAYFVCFMIIQTSSILFVYIRLSYTIASFTFANNNLHKAYQYGLIFLLAQQLAFIIDEISRASYFYSDQEEKFLYFLLFFCIILVLLTQKLREIQMRYILFRPNILTKMSPSQLFYKMALFQRLNSQSSTISFYDSIFKGFANEHLEFSCIHPNQVEICFCKQKVLYDPKKRKDTPLDKIFHSQNNSVFTKFIIKSWFETYIHFNQSDYMNYLYYSEFLYFKMKNVSLALKNLALLENKYLSPVQKFRLYRLKHIIIKHNRKRNHDSYRLNQSDKDNRNKLDIESVIPTEEQISQIQSGIKFIIKNNIRFWAYLDKSNINLNEINKLAKFSLKQLDLLKKLWKECMYHLDYRKKWRFYYCWYYLYILNRKVKVSMLERFSGISNVNENDVFSEELQQENMDDDVVSVHSNLKPDEMEKIYIKKVELAFDKKSVIFHVNHEYKGRILKVNRAIYHGFGYTALELTGQLYISQLMPRIYQNIHPVLMKNFAQTGKTKTLYSQRKIFCLNKAGYLFAAWKFVKQYVTISGKCEYVAMIRPITPPAGTKIYYIICNDDWDIDSMSEGIYEGFGINALQYQDSNLKQLLNILILAPKLIRYTKFAKYLTEQDFKLFQNQGQDKSKGNNQPKINFVQKMNIIGRLKREQYNAFKQDSMNSQKDSSLNVESDPHNTSTSTYNHQPLPQHQTVTKPLSSFNQSYFKQISGLNSTQNLSNTIQKPNISVNPTTPTQAKNQIQDQISPKTNSLVPNASIGPRKLQRKTTLIINTDDDKIIEKKPQSKLGIDDSDGSPRQINDYSRDIMSGDLLANQRRNSNLDILEQLNYQQNQSFQTNFIRDEMMKKQKNQQQQNLSNSGNEEAENLIGDVKSDYEDESEENLDQFEEDVNQYLKLDNLDRGDSVNFRLKIPTNLSELLNEYNQKISQCVQRKESRVEQTPSKNFKTTKFLQQSGTNKNQTVNFVTESHDKSVYNLIKDMILKYQIKKSLKEYNGSCTVSYKKTGKQKIIIMKLTKFDEGLKKNRNKNIGKQTSGSGFDDYGKKLVSITSGQLGNDYVRQISQSDPNNKGNFYVNMKSDLTDIKESSTSMVNNNIKFGAKRSDQINIDSEELAGQNTNQVQQFGKNNGMGYQLKLISEQDENGIISDRSLKTFHKDFMNRQGARNISLSQNDNIYIKEDNHKPNKSIKTISNLKLFVRIFFLSLIALHSFTFFYGPNAQFPVLRKQSNKIFQAKNVLLSALQAYNLVLDQIMFNKGNYDVPLKSNQFWNKVEYQNLIKSSSKNETLYFYQINSDANYKETFYDQQITPFSQFKKQIYTDPKNQSGQEDETYTLDTYDLFSQVIYSLQTLEETVPQDIQLDYTPVLFFRQNIFPNLYDGLRLAQNNLVDDLKLTTDKVYNFLIIIIIVEAVLLFASFLILFQLIYLICNAFKSIVEVFPKISQRDLKKIKNYNINLNLNFSYIVEKDDYLSGTHQIYQVYQKQQGAIGLGKAGSEHDGTENGGIVRKHTQNFDLEEPNDGNENVGKKSKDITDGGFLKKLKIKIFIFFAIFTLFVAIFTTVFLLLIMQSTKNLQRILDNGDVFMNTFGDNIVMMIAIKEKTLDKTNYNNVFQENISSLIKGYIQKNMQPRVETLDFLTFDNVFDEIFYGNPCVSFVQQLKEESTLAKSEECLEISQNSLQKGVASFNQFYKNAITNYVSNGIDSQELDNSIIFDYNRGIYYVDIFQVYLVKVWSENTDDYLSGQLTIIIIFVSVMFIALLIVYLILTEKQLIGRFNSEYSYFRTIYNMYMPDIIILKEKRIKFWLVKHYILNK